MDSSCITEILFPLTITSPFLLVPQFLETPILLSASVSFAILDSAYKRRHTVLSFFDWLLSPGIVLSGFPRCLRGEESISQCRWHWDVSSISRVGRSSGGADGNSLQDSRLEKPTDEPGGLQSMGSPRVGHDWAHTQCSPGPFMLLQMADLPPFVRLNNISLYIYTKFSLTIYPTFWLFSYRGYCEKCYSKHGSTGISLRFWFKFLRISMQKWGWLIIWNRKRPQIARATLRKDRAGGITLSDFKPYSIAVVTEAAWHHQRHQTHRYGIE